jgi:hypothetical protein
VAKGQDSTAAVEMDVLARRVAAAAERGMVGIDGATVGTGLAEAGVVAGVPAEREATMVAAGMAAAVTVVAVMVAAEVATAGVEMAAVVTVGVEKAAAVMAEVGMEASAAAGLGGTACTGTRCS